MCHAPTTNPALEKPVKEGKQPKNRNMWTEDHVVHTWLVPQLLVTTLAAAAAAAAHPCNGRSERVAQPADPGSRDTTAAARCILFAHDRHRCATRSSDSATSATQGWHAPTEQVTRSLTAEAGRLLLLLLLLLVRDPSVADCCISRTRSS